MIDNVIDSDKKIKGALIAVDTGNNNDFQYFIEEMSNLMEACQMEVSLIMVQQLSAPNKATYIGTGKLSELKTDCRNLEIDYCVFGETLTPSQLKNIADEVETTVLDRTGLILEIFAQRAKSRESRLQVESANLKYMLPRLIGMRASLGRQGGASGSMSNRGQGEKQLELDRRHIERRISELDKELELIEHDRDVKRAKREKSMIPSVALVGYTNAGKSTLMNKLISLSGASIEKHVFEKDMLFATLDTTVRRVHCEDNKDFILSDTVGFVYDLPHGLIKAFRSTLKEAQLSDLLLIVLDASDEHASLQLEVTETTLKELECENIQRIYVLNKSDKGIRNSLANKRDENTVCISALSGEGIDELVNRIKAVLYSDNKVIEGIIPYDKGGALNMFKEHANVLETEYLPEGVKIKADAPGWLIGQLRDSFQSCS